jgi:hypothetical protein
MHGLVEVGHISTIAIVPPAYILFSRHEKRESERKERKKSPVKVLDQHFL